MTLITAFVILATVIFPTINHAYDEIQRKTETTKAKGTCTTCSKDDFKATVVYMLEKSNVEVQ